MPLIIIVRLFCELFDGHVAVGPGKAEELRSRRHFLFLQDLSDLVLREPPRANLLEARCALSDLAVRETDHNRRGLICETGRIVAAPETDDSLYERKSRLLLQLARRSLRRKLTGIDDAGRKIIDPVPDSHTVLPAQKNPCVVRGNADQRHGLAVPVLQLLEPCDVRIAAHNLILLVPAVLRDIVKIIPEDMRAISGLFDALDTWHDCLDMACLVFEDIKVNKEKTLSAAKGGYSNATELADYLVSKGIPFREAHHIVGETVVYAIKSGKPLEDLQVSEFKQFCDKVEDDVYPILTIESILKKRCAKGGVSLEQIKSAIDFMNNVLSDRS